MDEDDDGAMTTGCANKEETETESGAGCSE